MIICLIMITYQMKFWEILISHPKRILRFSYMDFAALMCFNYIQIDQIVMDYALIERIHSSFKTDHL